MTKLSKAEKRKQRKEAQAKAEGEEMALAREVAAKVFDWDRLKNRCLTAIPAFITMARNLPNATILDAETDNPAIFIDNGASILGVAHLDTQAKSDHFAHINVLGDWWALAAQLDDRLGVFLLLDVLRHLGMEYDILLTTGEESGRSSAKKWRPPEGKEYNWMFECDRKDTDIVHYQYNDHKWLKAWRDVGFNRIERGSYTDIASMDYLGVCGMNIGVGYTEYHSVWSKANMTDCAHQVMRLIRFYHANADVRYPFDPQKPTAYSYPRGGAGHVDGYGAHWGAQTQHYAVTDADRLFKADQRLRHIETGRIVTISSAYPKISMAGSVRVRKWWCKVESADPDRPNLITYRDFNEDELEPLPDDKQLAAPSSAKEGESYGPGPKGRIEVPDREMTLIRAERRVNRYYMRRAELLVLRKECEGNPISTMTLQARWDYELFLFTDLAVECYSAEFVNGVERQPYQHGETVMTPEGLGVIDCSSPLTVRGLDYLYWVRMENKDSHGWQLQLVYESEITVIIDTVKPDDPTEPLLPPPLIQLAGPDFEEVSNAANGKNNIVQVQVSDDGSASEGC